MADIRALLAQATGFDWDSGPEAPGSAADRPGVAVSRAECEQLFLNEPLVAEDGVGDDQSVAEGATRSSREVRGHALGETDDGRLLFAAFAVCDTLVRVKVARPMTRTERQVYDDARRDEEESP